MTPIAKFERVSVEEYARSMGLDPSRLDEKDKAVLLEELEHIPLPSRSTGGSAGYDFHAPFTVAVDARHQATLPTGIRVKIEPGWFLALFPRSGMGFKYGFRLRNTTGIIDSDYYNAANEGHIMARVASEEPVEIKQGDRFMQGVFMRYGIAEEADVIAEREGGFGSTGV